MRKLYEELQTTQKSNMYTLGVLLYCAFKHNTQKTEVGIFVSEMNASQDLTELLIHFKIPCILSEIEE